jgi:hypothetical protein
VNDQTPTTTGRKRVAATDLLIGDAILADDGETVAYISGLPEVDGSTIVVKADLPGHGNLDVCFGNVDGKPEKVWILDEGHAAQPTDDLGEFDENHAPKIQD